MADEISVSLFLTVVQEIASTYRSRIRSTESHALLPRLDHFWVFPLVIQLLRPSKMCSTHSFTPLKSRLALASFHLSFPTFSSTSKYVLTMQPHTPSSSPTQSMGPPPSPSHRPISVGYTTLHNLSERLRQQTSHSAETTRYHQTALEFLDWISRRRWNNMMNVMVTVENRQMRWTERIVRSLETVIGHPNRVSRISR